MPATTLPPRQLVSASKVNSTPVFDREGKRIGQIEDLAIEKKSGQVRYAVLSFGGALGFGEKYFPLPWAILDYDRERNGYVIPVDRDVLRGAPAFSKQELAEAGDTDEGYRRPVYEYYRSYGAPTYW